MFLVMFPTAGSALDGVQSDPQPFVPGQPRNRLIPPTQLMPPDAKIEKPRAGAPQTPPGPAKQQTARTPPAEPPKPPTLNDLFDRLKTARTEDEAKRVNAMIEASMLESGSDTIDLLMYRALASVQNQDLALAFDLLDTIIALKPDYAEGWNKRATLYFMKRDYGKAISDVEMVLRLQPRHYNALMGLATMLRELGDKKHALDAMKRALALYPSNSGLAQQVQDMQADANGRDL